MAVHQLPPPPWETVGSYWQGWEAGGPKADEEVPGGGVEA